MYRRRNTLFCDEMHVFMSFGVYILFCSEKWDMYNVSGKIERRITSNAVLKGRRNNEDGEGAECQMETR